MEAKISVIVPVFNVESYLHRCVDSILSQTYQAFEVILVDDGSSDASPGICDEYAIRDNRVKVIHKQNGGLSSARNAGLNYGLTGSFVAFIDSDDWIERDTFEYGISLLAQSDSDAVQYALRLTDNPDKPIIQPKEVLYHFVGKDIIQYYMRHSTKDSAEYSVCIGLYHRRLFDQLRFREGKVNEDIDFKYHLMFRCKSMVVSNQIKYNYFQSGNTISAGGLKKQDFQLREAAEILESLTEKESYGSIASLGRVKKARTAFSLLCKIAYYGIADSSINKKTIVSELTVEHRRNMWVLLSSPISFSRKCLVVLFSISYPMAEGIIKLIKRL